MTCFTVEELIKELEGCSYSWTCQGVHDYDLLVDGCVTLTNEP